MSHDVASRAGQFGAKDILFVSRTYCGFLSSALPLKQATLSMESFASGYHGSTRAFACAALKAERGGQAAT